MRLPFFTKNLKLRVSTTIIFTAVFISPLFLAVNSGWAQVGFQIQFDPNDPYEIVLTAEKYREEFIKEDIQENKWREIYLREANELYKKVFSIDPYFVSGYLSYAYTEIMAAEVIGNKDVHYKKAEELIPKMDSQSPWSNMLQGQLYCIKGDWEKAKFSLEQAVQLGGNTSSLHVWLGYTLAALKNNDNAQKAYRNAIEANTDPRSFNWANDQLGKTGKPWSSPPMVPPTLPRQAIQPLSTKMRLQVSEFQDATNIVENAALRFSRSLVTTLFKAKRFNLVESQQKQPANNVDAVLSGSIIRVNSQTSEFVLDIKVTSPATGNLLLAEIVSISYTKQDNYIQITDKEVRKVAEMIERKLSRGEGKIINITGRYLMVNLGSEHDIQSGFTALVIGKNEKTVKNPFTGEVLSRDIYLGEIVFERVEEKYSYARLLTPGRMTMKVGDIVRLK